MAESETTILTKQQEKNSTILGVSVRAWVVIMLTGSMSLSYLLITIAVLIDAIFFSKDWGKVGTYTNISEPMYGAIMISLGFYFAQNKTQTNK